jgi:hypothetical protein
LARPSLPKIRLPARRRVQLNLPQQVQPAEDLADDVSMDVDELDVLEEEGEDELVLVSN